MTILMMTILVSIAAVMAAELHRRRRNRDGEWHDHFKMIGQPIDGERRVMRRWTGSAWAYRPMTSAEADDLASREAW